MIDYSPLWQTMKEKGMTQYRLFQKGLDTKTIYNIRHGRKINISTVEKLCIILDCTPNDIFMVVKDPSD